MSLWDMGKILLVPFNAELRNAYLSGGATPQVVAWYNVCHHNGVFEVYEEDAWILVSFGEHMPPLKLRLQSALSETQEALLKQLRNELKETRDTLRDREYENRELRRSNELLQAEVKNYQDRCSDLEYKLKEATLKIESMRDLVASMKADLEANMEAEHVPQQVEDLKQEVADLQYELIQLRGASPHRASWWQRLRNRLRKGGEKK
ncbi:MAG: hypothetical protein D6820_05070 [Lentisphaerae bacterium]|nr:MAG: hypothetical protein D6820_05070 [Lentisphaerota bacterium]